MMAMPLAEEFDAEEVFEAVRRGDRYAFEELVRTQGRWVRGVVFGVLGRRECVEDVCQQVWTAAWLRIGELRDVRSWRPWLYRIARNHAIDAGRDLTRHRARVQETSRSTSVVRAEPADEEQRQRVMAAIQGLPALYREPFILRHLNDWSYRQIAEVMGLPVDSVETRLVRARHLLRDALVAEGN